MFNDIRALFVNLPEAKIRAYKPGRFSFNVKGGRCETCRGNGYKTIEMNFLPDVYVPCETCPRQNATTRETLEVRFKGKSIADVLDMTINQAVEFFENVPNILHKIKVLQEVGLGYLKLGQSCTTLSGGESQRINLSTSLGSSLVGSLYTPRRTLLGLHSRDTDRLIHVLKELRDVGNTVIVVEHDEDIIRAADHLIDIGPKPAVSAAKWCGRARSRPPMRRTIPTKRRAAATRSTSSPAPKPFPYPLRAVGGIASSTSSVLAKTTSAASMCAFPSMSSPS